MLQIVRGAGWYTDIYREPNSCILCKGIHPGPCMSPLNRKLQHARCIWHVREVWTGAKAFSSSLQLVLTGHFISTAPSIRSYLGPVTTCKVPAWWQQLSLARQSRGPCWASGVWTGASITAAADCIIGSDATTA